LLIKNVDHDKFDLQDEKETLDDCYVQSIKAKLSILASFSPSNKDKNSHGKNQAVQP